jgi:hypothetical protein
MIKHFHASLPRHYLMPFCHPVEKARRLFIDAKIRELGALLPSRGEM